MKRNELKEGYLVELKNGNKYIIMSYIESQSIAAIPKLVLCNENTVSVTAFEYDENLRDANPVFSIDHSFDIEKVWGLPFKRFCLSQLFDTSIRNLLWQREVQEMTLEEVCDALGYEVKIVKNT